MAFINLTPHAIHVNDRTFPPSGSVARLSSQSVVKSTIDEIDLCATVFGAVEGLPDEVEGTWLIVSMLVRNALPSRCDLVSPGDMTRDAQGNITGCKNFNCNLV